MSGRRLRAAPRHPRLLNGWGGRYISAIEVFLGLLAVFLLTLGTAFFVASEFALVAVDPHGVDQLADEGDRRALGARSALRHLSFQLSGAQLGITVTSVVVGF